jgi:hypothetical protein
MTHAHYIESEESIDPRRFSQINPTDPGKVDAMVADLRRGARMPPVIASQHVNMLHLHDGHHRAAAHATLGLPIRCLVRVNSDRCKIYTTTKGTP